MEGWHGGLTWRVGMEGFMEGWRGGLAWRVSWRVGVESFMESWRGGLAWRVQNRTRHRHYPLYKFSLKYVYIEVKWLKPVCGECGGWRVHSQFLCIPGFYVVFFNPLGICN